jgi:tetratricopeptide (TPR) repeat protein
LHDMKPLRSCLFILVLFTACNNKEPEKKITDNSIQTSVREQVLKDSIAKFPGSILLKEQLIQYYRDSEDFDKAIAYANEILQKDSLNDRLWDIKATLYFENDDTLNAIKAYETAVQLNPQPRYIILLGSLYAQTKNARALDMADFLLKAKIADTDKEAFFIKGLYYNYAGEKIKAMSFFDKCLNLDYNYMIAYREKGIALYDMGKYEDAVTVLDKAVTLQNNFDEGYYWLGRCLEKLNKPADAIEEYKTALMYSPDYVEAKAALERLQAP